MNVNTEEERDGVLNAACLAEFNDDAFHAWTSGHDQRWAAVFKSMNDFDEAITEFVDAEAEAGWLEGDYGPWVRDIELRVRRLAAEFHAHAKHEKPDDFDDHEICDCRGPVTDGVASF